MFGFQSIKRDKDFKFKNNFLKTATFQIGYKQIEMTKEKYDWLSDYFKKKYENVQAVVQNNLVIKSGLSNPSIVNDTKALQGVRITPKDNSVNVSITNDQILYTFPGVSYKNFSEFINSKKEEIDDVIKYLNIRSFNRLAIRKINMINYTVTENGVSRADVAGMIFNNGLVENMKIIPNNSKVVKGLSNVLVDNNGDFLNLIYGFVKSEEAPGTSNAVLDIDISLRSKEVVHEKLYETFEEINDEIFNIFCWSLQEETRSKLNE